MVLKLEHLDFWGLIIKVTSGLLQSWSRCHFQRGARFLYRQLVALGNHVEKQTRFE